MGAIISEVRLAALYMKSGLADKKASRAFMRAMLRYIQTRQALYVASDRIWIRSLFYDTRSDWLSVYTRIAIFGDDPRKGEDVTILARLERGALILKNCALLSSQEVAWLKAALLYNIPADYSRQGIDYYHAGQKRHKAGVSLMPAWRDDLAAHAGEMLPPAPKRRRRKHTTAA